MVATEHTHVEPHTTCDTGRLAWSSTLCGTPQHTVRAPDAHADVAMPLVLLVVAMDHSSASLNAAGQGTVVMLGKKLCGHTSTAHSCSQKNLHDQVAGTNKL